MIIYLHNSRQQTVLCIVNTNFVSEVHYAGSKKFIVGHDFVYFENFTLEGIMKICDSWSEKKVTY